MTLGERIRKVRKVLDLTQQEFSDKIGSKRNTVATYEMGRTDPSAAVISLICREFNVSEAWLRTGEGAMFAPEPAFDLGEYAKRHGMTALETAILKAYLDIDPNIRENLLQHFKERLTNLDTSGQQQAETDTVEQTQAEMDKPKKTKEPTPGGGDGLDKMFIKYKDRLDPDQKQMLFDQMLGMIGQPKESLSVFAQQTDVETTP